MAIQRAAASKNRKKKVPTVSRKRKVGIWIARLAFLFFGFTLFWVLLLKVMNPPVTYLQLLRAVERKADGKEWKIEKSWLSYDELSDNLKRAAIGGEDATFLDHNGFDTKAIMEAFKKNQDGKKLRGGSTISQQVAKNVFLWPGRSWFRKGLESYFTVMIELFWSKKRILEIYLNVIEMGQGVYGAEAAAQYYYHKSAKSLSKKEAALIIAILPSPQKWDARRPSSYVNSRANNIVRYMSYYRIPE